MVFLEQEVAAWESKRTKLPQGGYDSLVASSLATGPKIRGSRAVPFGIRVVRHLCLAKIDLDFH